MGYGVANQTHWASSRFKPAVSPSAISGRSGSTSGHEIRPTLSFPPTVHTVMLSPAPSARGVARTAYPGSLRANADDRNIRSNVSV